MKKFRPYSAGYIVIYALCLLCVGDAAVSLVQQITGTMNEYMASFSLFSYLIAAVAVAYAWMYVKTRVEFDGSKMHIVYPVYIRPAAGQKRAFIIFRSGDTDVKLVDKRFDLKELEKFGYIDDLGYARLDKSQAGEKNKLFPVKEIALVMQDGKRYHLNVAIYSQKQKKEMVAAIIEGSGLQPEGSLKEILKEGTSGKSAK